MKLNPRFVGAIVFFLLLILVAQWQMPRRFQWEPSFRSDDKQPFGCYVVDSLIRISVPQQYTVTDSTLYQLDHGKFDKPRGIIIVANDFEPSKTDVKSLMHMLESGCHVMILAGSTSNALDDTLGVGVYGGSSFSMSQVKKMIRAGYKEDSLHWVGRPQRYANRVYRILPQVVPGSLTVDDKLKYHTLYNKWTEVWVDDSTTEWQEEPAAVAVRKGKGRLVIGCDPLLFTNYTVLDKDNNHLLFRMLSEMDSLPIARTEAYLMTNEQTSSSPLRFFLSNEPLRWAVWLTVAGLLLFFAFTSRRRQRVIPVVAPPENKSMEFVKLIGTLYHQWHDNKDLVRKRYVFFAENLRRQLMVDVDNEALDGQTVDVLSVHTGLRREVLRRQLSELRRVVASDEAIVNDEMERFVDEMVEIERLVNN